MKEANLITPELEEVDLGDCRLKRLRRSFLLLPALLAALAGCRHPESAALAGATTGTTPQAAASTRPSGRPYVRVLGTVQDGGLPHAACSCDRCELARRDPSHGRQVASLALVIPPTGRIYLFDATPDIGTQLRRLVDVRAAPADRVDRSPIDGIFLTHAHIGHYLGLAFFGYEAVHTSRLPVFTTPRMAAFLTSNGPWSQLVELENIVPHQLEPGESRSFEGGVVVTAVSAPHRDEYADTLGFVIAGPNRRLFYLPDTDSWAAWKTPVADLLGQMDVALLDGTFFSGDELPGRSVEEIGHPLILQSIELLGPLVSETGVEIYFTHLNHSNPALDDHGEERRRIEAQGFFVLREGQEFAL